MLQFVKMEKATKINAKLDNTLCNFDKKINNMYRKNEKTQYIVSR